MAFDAFMWFEGGALEPQIVGETADSIYRNSSAFEILTFSWGVSNPSTVGSGTIGSGGGKARLSSFLITKPTDKASPDLFMACCMGNHFRMATVILRKAGGVDGKPGIEYLRYEFAEVFIDSIQWEGTTGGLDRPVESVSFSYAACQITYSPQAATGTATRDKIVAWSTVLNRNTLAV